MHRSVAFSLPLIAIAIVAAVAWLVLGSPSEERSDAPAAAAPNIAVAVATQLADWAPALHEAGDICQGLASRPGADDPIRFAGVYVKQTEVNGIHIVAVDSVADEAIDIAVDTVAAMLSPQLAADLAAEGAYVVVMSDGQKVLDLPEFACKAGTPEAALYADVCGVADRADYPVVTVSELDLLGRFRGPCGGLNVLYHELGHLVQGWAIGPADYVEIRLLYQEARESGAYEGQYAMRNTHEYFAEATQAYFLSIDRSGRRDREWLRVVDPKMFALLSRLYGEPQTASP